MATSRPNSRRTRSSSRSNNTVFIVGIGFGVLLVAVILGVMTSVGFWAIDLPFWLLIGMIAGFLNIIPYLGSIIGLSISLPLAFFQSGGGWGRLLAVVIIISIVQLIESYVLTPKIMGDRTGLHFMAIIILFFFRRFYVCGIVRPLRIVNKVGKA